MSAAYRLGAVVYHPKVEQIWREFGAWFGAQGFALAPRYHERYEDQVDDLVAGRIDAAWNTNLAHVLTLRRTGDEAGALAMRDTDRGWRSLIVALAGSGCSSLEGLRGRRVGFGDADSPQAQILPVHALRSQGWDPLRDFRPRAWTVTSESTVTPEAPSSPSSRACAPASSTPASSPASPSTRSSAWATPPSS